MGNTILKESIQLSLNLIILIMTKLKQYIVLIIFLQITVLLKIEIAH